MKNPPRVDHYEDRFLDCQAEMEDHFVELIEAACAAGWTQAEAIASVTELADNYMLKLAAIDDTELQIKKTRCID